MRVASIRRLKRQAIRIDQQGQIHDVLERNIRRVRAVPRTPAHVETHEIRVNALQRVVQRVNTHARERAVILNRRLRVHLIPDLRDIRRINLDRQARVRNPLVLLAQHVRARPHHGLVVLVERVSHASRRTRRNRRHETIRHGLTHSLQRVLHARDIALHGLGTDVGQLTRNRRERNRVAVRDVNTRIRIRVRVRETLPVAALSKRREGQAAIAAGGGTHVETLDVLKGQSAETREGIRPPRTVINRVDHRVAVLAVVDDIQADLGLTLHNAVNLILQKGREISIAKRALAARAIRLNQLGGAGQGTNMSGANSHRSPFSSLCPQPTFRASRTGTNA